MVDEIRTAEWEFKALSYLANKNPKKYTLEHLSYMGGMFCEYVLHCTENNRTFQVGNKLTRRSSDGAWMSETSSPV